MTALTVPVEVRMPRALLSLSLVNLVLFLACAGGKDEGDGGDTAVDTEPEVIDADGDGVRVENDCDDNDASVYPGAAEPCDERDNDCDGSVDEGANASFFADDDGDGFGRDSSDLLACEAPEGYVSVGGDCDDENAARSPSLAERCDMARVDENCDAAANEGCECYVGETRACPGESDECSKRNLGGDHRQFDDAVGVQSRCAVRCGRKSECEENNEHCKPSAAH